MSKRRDAFTSKPEIKACGGLFVVNLWRPQQEAATQNQFRKLFIRCARIGSVLDVDSGAMTLFPVKEEATSHSKKHSFVFNQVRGAGDTTKRRRASVGCCSFSL